MESDQFHSDERTLIVSSLEKYSTCLHELLLNCNHPERNHYEHIIFAIEVEFFSGLFMSLIQLHESSPHMPHHPTIGTPDLYVLV